MSKNTNMTAEQAKKITLEIKSGIDTLPKLVYQAMKGKAYLALGYTSVADWSKAEFGLSRSRIYQYMGHVHAELTLIDSCDLSPDWTMNESHFREFTGERLEKLVEGVFNEVCDETDQSKRDTLAKKAVLKAREQLDANKAPKNPVAGVVAQAAQASSADTQTVAMSISPVVSSFEVLKVKAVDTASVLTAWADCTESESASLLPQLQDARLVLDELIASLVPNGDAEVATSTVGDSK